MIHIQGLCSCANSYGVGVVVFSTQSFVFGRIHLHFCNTHMVYDTLVVDMLVYDIQV